MKKPRFNNAETAIITIAIIVFLVIVILLANLFWGKVDINSTNQYVAIGTLLLALVTGTLAFISWWNIRESNEKEKRDRKERKLNEIRDWALSVAEYALVRQSPVNTELEGLHTRYELLLSASEYISEVAKESFADLRPLVDDVIVKIKDLIDTICEFIVDQKHGGKLIRSQKALADSVKSLLKAIAKVNY